MKFSTRTMHRAVTGAVGAGALSAALMFGSIPAAGATPAPAPATTFAAGGPGPAIVPAGWGHGGWGHGGWDHGGWGPGGWGPGGWGNYPGWHGWRGWVHGGSIWRQGGW